MTNERPAPRGSLIERAAEVYDFRAALERRGGAEAPASSLPAADAGPVFSGALGRFGTIDRAELRAGGYIVPDAPVTAIAEEFRLVKRELLLAARGGDALDRGRLILVASAQPDDGKTFCAVNLALSIAAEKDAEVLLVDGDFAKPEILSILGLETGPGFIDALADPGVDVESCIIRTDLPGLSVLPAGRKSHEATELLASDRTRAVLAQLTERNPARIVLFDSPPVLAASEASVLALHCGQVLMVVRADRTGEAPLREAIGLLGRGPAVKLLLNGVAFAPRGRRFGSYYGLGE